MKTNVIHTPIGGRGGPEDRASCIEEIKAVWDDMRKDLLAQDPETQEDVKYYFDVHCAK